MTSLRELECRVPEGGRRLESTSGTSSGKSPKCDVIAEESRRDDAGRDARDQARVQTTPFPLKDGSQCQAVSSFSARTIRKLMLGRAYHGSSGVHATTFPSFRRIYGDRLRFPAGALGRARSKSSVTKARASRQRVTIRPGIL